MGLILPFVNTFITWPKITPPAVLNINAISPRTIILIVSSLRKESALIVAPTEMPRKIVVAFRTSFCAAWLRRSVHPHSRRRLPNISIPIRGTAGGRISPQAIVEIIGKRILSVRDTGRSCSIFIERSAFVVKSLIIGGWIRGTSDI